MLDAWEPSTLYLKAKQPALFRRFEQLATAPGGVARLRSLVLALAVQGKLVPQESNEGHASALLEQLHTRRSESARNGAGNKSFDIASREDVEFPCDLPAGWVWIRLSDLGQFCGGKTPSKQHPAYWSGSIPWITPKDMKQLRLQDSEDHVSHAAVEDGLALVPPNSLLVVVRSGILRRTVPTAVNVVETTINQDLKALKLLMPEMAPYVQLLIRGFERFILKTLVKVGTTVESIRFDELAAQPFPLPQLAEQARIVDRVDELMRLCDALEAKGRLEAEQHARLLDILLGTLTDSSTPEELAANWQRVADHFDLLLDRPEAVDALEQTILQLAVRGLLVSQVSSDQPASSLLDQIRTSGEQKKTQGKKVGPLASEVQPYEVPFEVPESWAWSRFGQVAEIASDLVSPAAHGSEWQVAPDCIEKGTGRLLAKRTVADADVKSANHRFHPGQIIYSKIRPSLSKAVIVDFAGLCSADMYPINSKISTQYLLLVILSRCFLDQVAAAENRVKMPKLNKEALTAFFVPVPPLAEQERIVARVTDLRRLCTDLRQRLSRSRTTQAAMAEALIDYALAA